MVGRKTRVLVVDDSAVVRAVLSRQLANDAQIEVVGQAPDGVSALEMVRELAPDVVTLDVEMPGADGLTTLEAIMRERPTPVVMVSGQTSEGAAVTIRALEAGAVDFVAKPVHAGVPALHRVTDELRAKVKVAAGVTSQRMAGRSSSRGGVGGGPARREDGPWGKELILIASSTGGPAALQTVLSSLPADIVPTVVVQHMPREFTRSLAERLDQLVPPRVREARPGQPLEAGQVLVAPGGYHAIVTRKAVRLRGGKPQNGMRPSADVTMESAAKVFGEKALGVVLTGMGVDGTRGAGAIRAAGGQVIAQDEATSVVYGMPRSVAEAGWADRVAPLQRIAGTIVEMCRQP